MQRLIRLLPWILLAVTTLIALQMLMPSKTPNHPPSSQNRPQTQWQLSQLHRWQYSLSKPQQLYLQARTAKDIIDSKTHTETLSFQSPQIVSLSPDKATYIQSQQGQLITQGQQQHLTLSGQVWLQQQNHQGKRLQMATDLAYYDLLKTILTAPNFVKITQPQLTITGKGLMANIQQQTYQLNQQVHTHYQPKPQ